MNFQNTILSRATKGRVTPDQKRVNTVRKGITVKDKEFYKTQLNALPTIYLDPKEQHCLKEEWKTQNNHGTIVKDLHQTSAHKHDYHYSIIIFLKYDTYELYVTWTSIETVHTKQHWYIKKWIKSFTSIAEQR